MTTFEELKNQYIADRYQNFIGGEWVDGVKGETFDVYCPANGKYLTTVTKASEEDVDKAVDAAWKAFPGWKATPFSQRARILNKIADILEANATEIAWIECLECGRGFPATVATVYGAAGSFRYFAGAIATQEGISNMVDPYTVNMINDEPVGVVAGITAWNAPMVMNGMKFPPALAAGCTIIYRPSSIAPLATLRMAQLIQEVLPPGVINVLTGPASTMGQYILEHPGIRKTSFTGSAETGRTVGIAAAQKLAPATLELGGRSANIFFPDVYDMDMAVNGMIASTINWNGQQCANGTRVFVHEDIYDEFIAKCVKAYESTVVGPPWWDGIQMGACSSEEQMNKVLGYIELAKEEGAKIATGGYRLTEGELGEGYFIAPTILYDCSNDWRSTREEIFGPVCSIIKFKTEEEVIAMANDNPYGLAGGVWTKDINKALRVAKAIDTGTMFVNTYDLCCPPYPWAGHKDSGIGSECVRETIAQFCKKKSIVVNIDENSYMMGRCNALWGGGLWHEGTNWS